MSTHTRRIASVLTCLVVALTCAPSPAQAVTKVITSYDSNESARDGWDARSARIAKRDGTYYARLVWYDGYFDDYRRIVHVRFKVGPHKNYVAEMIYDGSRWFGRVWRQETQRFTCRRLHTRWGNDRRNVTMRFPGRCVGDRVPKWVSGNSLVYTSVGNVADVVPRTYG